MADSTSLTRIITEAYHCRICRTDLRGDGVTVQMRDIGDHLNVAVFLHRIHWNPEALSQWIEDTIIHPPDSAWSTRFRSLSDVQWGCFKEIFHQRLYQQIFHPSEENSMVHLLDISNRQEALLLTHLFDILGKTQSMTFSEEQWTEFVADHSASLAGAGLEPNGVQQPSDQGSDQTQRDSAEPQPFLMQQDTGTGSTVAGPAVFPWQPAVEDDTASSSEESAQSTNDTESHVALQINTLVNEAFDVLARFTSDTQNGDEEEAGRLLGQGKWLHLFDTDGDMEQFIDEKVEGIYPDNSEGRYALNDAMSDHFFGGSIRFRIGSTYCSHQHVGGTHRPVNYPDTPTTGFWQNVFLDYYRVICVTHANYSRIESGRRWDCLVLSTIFILALVDRFDIPLEGVGDLSIIIWRFMIIFSHSIYARALRMDRALLSNLAKSLRLAIGHDRSGFPNLYGYLDLSERMLKSGGIILGEWELQQPVIFGLNLRRIVVADRRVEYLWENRMISEVNLI